MDFFGRQDEARRRTRFLVILFGLAVAAIVGAVYTVVVLLGLYAGLGSEPRLWDPGLFLGVAAATGAVILGGSTYKTAALARGGEAVAELLGGRPVPPDTEDHRERKLLNVVGEMAIASGTPVPGVYVLDRETGINAFAAGFDRDDAVVAVTRGCLEQLDRDELQGVIAHEFSHIFHGDMRLNLRLMGILHGILVIGLLGYWLLRSSRLSRGGGRRGKGNLLPLFGLALLVIGYVGVFFAKMIKSAVSRQREFLADAAGVQYTRAPWGLAGALKKIGGWSEGSRIDNAHAEEASHLFFGEGVGGALFRWMSTHPPLEERIQRLDPAFEGGVAEAVSGPMGEALAGLAGGRGSGAAPAGTDPTVPLRPESASETVGSPGPRHVEWSARVMAELPVDLRRRAREPSAARGAVLGLLISSDPELRRRQLQRVAEVADEDLARSVEAALPELRGLSSRLRLPLVDLALPSLRRMSTAQYGAFRLAVDEVVRSDRKLSLFEFALRKILTRRLDSAFRRRRAPTRRRLPVEDWVDGCAVLLSALAHVGHGDPDQVREAFAEGASHIGDGLSDMAPIPRSELSLSGLDEVLDRLAGAGSDRKRRLLAAAAASVGWDGRVAVAEGELFRAFADALGCPMPPLLPDLPAEARGSQDTGTGPDS